MVRKSICFARARRSIGRKPAFPARLYPNHFWQKLFREMAYDDEQGVFLLLPTSHTTTLPTDTVVYDPASNIYAKVPGASPIQGAHVNPLNFMLQYHPARKMFLLVTGQNKMPVTVTVWAFKLDYGRLMSP